jgi:tetratricopeptide (TPR) repeat protein
VACAVLTEAVSGIVGIADVLGGMGALLALLALGLSAWTMPIAVFLAVLFGLFCKESALVCVPLLPFAALVTAPLTHPKRPLSWLRAVLALAASAAAFVLYVELRRRWFPSPIPAELTTTLADTATTAERLTREFLLWFHQAPLPRDPLHNPLAPADTPHRIAGALRVYARGLGQLLLPRALSGDYSYPQEPIPTHLVFPGSVAGAALMVFPLLAAPALWALSWRRLARERQAAPMASPSLGAAGAAVTAVGLVWIVISYFPHSNIPVVLPTVRAERFWYFPAIGSSLTLGVLFAWLHRATRHGRLARLTPTMLGAFLLFQGAQAYRHAMDYRDDLAFWQATKDAVPNSAKAHLNYSVMKGARQDLDTRLKESLIAAELAPQWAMARIYTGDTLCRMHRSAEAWPHYQRGFEMGPNELSLIALALQCLYDEKALTAHETELRALAATHEGTWIAYLAIDTLDNGATHKGVDPKYRPRGYNEGPKDKGGGE